MIPSIKRGDAEPVARVAETDWSATTLGPRGSWPPILEYAVQLCLGSRQPMCLFWGADLACVANDAMLPLLRGARHPSLDALRALADGTSEPMLAEDVALASDRVDGRSDSFYTFAYVNVGRPPEASGVLCTAYETTGRVDRERVRFARETQALIDFQRAALPQCLPTVAGLRFSAVYESAQADALVGGDWYDAFPLSDGRVVLSVGDVSGSGLQAAITMAAVRQTIRGAVQLYPDPVAVLDAADRALRSEQPDRIVTAFVGVLDPITRGFSYASAGHPPPILRGADGTIRELVATDLPLGLRDEGYGADAGWTTLPEDCLLVLHTDGLTESTRNILEGERRVHAALATTAVYEAAEPARAVRDAVIAGPSSDDVAILVVRLDSATARDGRRFWSFDGADATLATHIRRDFAAALRLAGADDAEAADAELVFGELLGNVVRHANGTIEAALDVTGPDPVLHVLDRGPGFTFHTRLPHDAMSESGRGLYIIAHIARDVTVVPRWDGGSHARVVLKTQPLRHARRI